MKTGQRKRIAQEETDDIGGKITINLFIIMN